MTADAGAASRCPAAGAPAEGGHPGRRAFVTGATGFLGQRVAHQLLARGVEVHAALHHTEPDGASGLCWHAMDMEDRASQREVFESVRPDLLVHLAWSLRDDYQTSPENWRWVEWSLALAREFLMSGGRHILMAGSCAEYEWSDKPLGEKSLCRPATPYGAAKLSLGNEILGLADDSVTVLWPRMFFLFGEGERRSRVIPRLIGDIDAGRSVDWISPETRRDYLDAGEASAAMVHLVLGGATGVVNVASGTALTVQEIAGIIATALGTRAAPIAPTMPAASDPVRICADVSRLRRLGWAPSRSVAESLTALSQATTSRH